jgi:hypothetical protein
MAFEMHARSGSDHRSLVNAFIILNVVAIFFWAQPFPYRVRSVIKEITAGYMHFCGVWQEWNMFAPQPRTLRIRMDATVTFRDGSTKTWIFPQMDQMTLWDRLRKERYRKWAHDSVRLDAESGLWAPTANYIARQFPDPDNPPVAVQLHRYWADIPGPTETVGEKTEPSFRSYTFYETKIVAGALE